MTYQNAKSKYREALKGRGTDQTGQEAQTGQRKVVLFCLQEKRPLAQGSRVPKQQITGARGSVDCALGTDV